ncbi:type II toxin-antitoxin system VapC family toxin [Rhizobium sp. TRM95796]|uniref:type II toxin-antitoxin system VapC family toxin n=1 Tax=Rhizobium sp. TRM95796 TaxID=2979862 RepID=UPI0021E895AB|nr:type II toxin-antitoxin system VapC family toxin [Rhizobium sp. TRM95796]MCV3764318.1 type II toxin-antitoxin system VapC family toxin [Rhizobium sp. TRM95796]
MILVDTNVISEAWRPTPAAEVIAWLDHQALDTLFLSAITVAELRYGVGIMPLGKRKQVLERRLEEEVLPLFAERVLPFDLPASAAYAFLMSSAKNRGRAISFADGLIAATAMSRGFSVATRDLSPYLAAGINAIDPWRFAI